LIERERLATKNLFHKDDLVERSRRETVSLCSSQKQAALIKYHKGIFLFH